MPHGAHVVHTWWVISEYPLAIRVRNGPDLMNRMVTPFLCIYFYYCFNVGLTSICVIFFVDISPCLSFINRSSFILLLGIKVKGPRMVGSTMGDYFTSLNERL